MLSDVLKANNSRCRRRSQAQSLLQTPSTKKIRAHPSPPHPLAAPPAMPVFTGIERGVVELTTLTGASIDSLLSEIRRRVLAANPDDGQSWPAGWSADNPGIRRRQNDEERGNLSG
jgi:hypothetical protein